MTKLHETITSSKIMDFYGFELLRSTQLNNICNKDLVVLCFISIILTQHSQHPLYSGLKFYWKLYFLEFQENSRMEVL